MYNITETAAILNAELLSGSLVQPALFNLKKDWQLLTDSRNLTQASNSIFFAIKTQHSDGHLYIQELAQKGVNVFVISNDIDTTTYNDCIFLKVKDTVLALQLLAKRHRENFNIPIIGITGSNGKTIVKEWLNTLLSTNENICASPKSYNSQIGVPLSVWQLNKKHTLGIFEAGISKINEMQSLQEIIKPTIGILTHIGSAHDEGFNNRQEKTAEKLKLFKDCKTVLMKYAEMDMPAKTLETFDFNNANANLNITSVATQGKTTRLMGEYNHKPTAITIPFTDEASIENASLCWLVCLFLNQFKEDSFYTLQPISMRLELKQAINNSLLINDSYSNDLNALTSAFSFLKRQTIHSKSTVILSDIEQSGLSNTELCIQVNELLISNNISRFIGIGQIFSANQALFNVPETYFFTDTDAFVRFFNRKLFENETILLKGARSFHFEDIAAMLEKQLHGTVLEINLTAAQHNLQYIKSILPTDIKIMAMVKAFAYGSGSFEMAKMLQQKVEYLAVAYADEGITLRQAGITLPIMVLNTEQEAFTQLMSYKLEPVIFSIAQLQNVIQILNNNSLNIHIEIDTGMHRLGFSNEDIQNLTSLLLQHKNIVVKSVFSHLSASDEAQYDDFTTQQYEAYAHIAQQIETTIGYTVIKHISNTAAALRFSQQGLNMVRLGIGLYGIDPSGQHQQALENVFTLKTTISQVKTIAANESIGYARKAIANHQRKIAILAIGYADGLNRLLSNGKGTIEINGTPAPIVGNICMDMCMVDVTEIACQAGDEAIVFGKKQSIITLANTLQTIPYEILTAISQRVKRVYVSE